jgi:hypothetical protein
MRQSLEGGEVLVDSQAGLFLRGVLKASAMLAAFASVAVLSGCGSGQRKNPVIDGIIGPNVNLIQNKFILTMTLKNVSLDGGIRVPVPKMPSSYVEIGPDFQSNGLLVGVGVDVQDLARVAGNAAEPLDPLTLPGGRALPGVAEGFLPGLAVQVPQWNRVAFYLAKTVFGVFVPVNLPWDGVAGTFRFYDGKGDRIGNLSIIGKDEYKSNSGILLLIDLKGKVGRLAGMI